MSESVTRRTRRNHTFMNQKYGLVKMVWKANQTPVTPRWNTRLAVLTAPWGSVAFPNMRKNW